VFATITGCCFEQLYASSTAAALTVCVDRMSLDQLREVVGQLRAEAEEAHQDDEVDDGSVLRHEAVHPQLVTTQGLHDLVVAAAAAAAEKQQQQQCSKPGCQ
jgi:hypothetical protein